MKSIIRRKSEYYIMAQLGKLILGFFVLATCFIGLIVILSQSNLTGFTQVNIGVSEFNNSSTMTNQTLELVSSTTTFGTSAGIIMLFILGAMIIIAALTLLAGRH